LALTFPLILRFRSSVPGGSVDLWQNYWNFWWWKKALWGLHQSPFTTQYLFHPTGTDATMTRLRADLERIAGPAALEDEATAIFFLRSAPAPLPDT
jgi:hypothetical protein